MNESDTSQFSLNHPEQIVMNKKSNNPPFYHYQNNRLDPIEPPVSPENVDISLLSPI